jgi:hypothetical protein
MKKYLDTMVLKVPGGCWVWLGLLDKYGYGHLSWRRPGQPVLGKAHRAAFIVYHGEPGSLHVCHSCDVRNCLNPDHLFLGTNAENMADKVAKDRQAKGTKNGCAVLTEAQVLDIRRSYVRGGLVTQAELGAMHGVNQQTVSAIVNGKQWKHI